MLSRPSVDPGVPVLVRRTCSGEGGEQHLKLSTLPSFSQHHSVRSSSSHLASVVPSVLAVEYRHFRRRSSLYLLIIFTHLSEEVQSPDIFLLDSAPTRPLGENASRRLSLAGGSGAKSIPDGYGIDPATGLVCAGDPSLILKTNVDMGDKKKEFMAAASKALSAGLGKPESFVAVCVDDGQDIIWGGVDTPCALGCCYSLGAINNENNKKVSAEISKLLEEFGVPANKIYINFFDVPRENIGYNGATFAG